MWIVLVTKTLMKTKMLVLPNDADVVCPLFQLMHHRRAPATWKWPCVLPSPERAFRISSRRTTETPDYFGSASLLLPTAFATRSTCRLTTSPSTVSAIIRLKTTACVILSSGVKQYSGRWGTASPLNNNNNNNNMNDKHTHVLPHCHRNSRHMGWQWLLS